MPDEGGGVHSRYLALKNWFFLPGIVLLFLGGTFISRTPSELHAPDEDGEEVRDLGDAVWLVLISMTTVGCRTSSRTLQALFAARADLEYEGAATASLEEVTKYD